MTWYYWTLLGLLIAWLLINEVSPLATVFFCKPLDPKLWVPLVARTKVTGIRFYQGHLLFGPACSMTCFHLQLVFLHTKVSTWFTPTEIDAILAHEIGHQKLHHLRKRWLIIVTGLVMIPFFKRILRVDHEEQADIYAAKLIGWKPVRSMRDKIRRIERNPT